MPTIYVETDNSDPDNKLYTAAKAGKAAAKAEEKMQKAVRKIIGKTSGFTTLKYDNAKGYVIRLEVSKVDTSGHQTQCSLSGSIVRYPMSVAQKGKGQGEEMLSTGMTGSATATGTSDNSILDCVEAVAEDLAAKAVPIMRDDFAKR
jgi:hypothetical protein